ncbi:fibrobacter succinogenes major paralogous domain-containing protein [Tenacibaculum agarivorans]|uniref:FISUMP domain-containing protein n=1 Tax=Tenacibaculum agarivorans TaxID=1908389 RepID=UPI00117CF16B|nr:FISUMP domain-containing protein [Tenacibaculum agarivorans]
MNIKFKNSIKRGLLVTILTSVTIVNAQVGIGTNTPDASAALEVRSTTKGLLLPRLTNAQINTISNPAEGLIIYCIDCAPKGVYVYDGISFKSLLDNTAVDNSPSALVLSQIGNEADNPDVVNSVVTVAQLGMITPALLGIVASNQTDYQNYIDSNPDNFSVPATTSEVQAMINAVNGFGQVTGAGGAIWLDRNLGASRVATSTSDADAYGDLYQWGRNTDGHQSRTSNTATGPVASGNEGSNFIIGSNNWLNAKDNTRWNGTTKGIHDPCPSGFRVPTSAEWLTERDAWSTQDADGGFSSPLKLPITGFRASSTGEVRSFIRRGFYWSSIQSGNSGPEALELIEGVNFSQIANPLFASGQPVRCIKE